MIPEPVDVREAHRFDIARLEDYLCRHVAGFAGPLTVRQFRGGQSNPTYHLGTPRAQYVLRRKPPGKLLPSAHAVEREYRVITALAGTGVPVPATYAGCDDADVIGRLNREAHGRAGGHGRARGWRSDRDRRRIVRQQGDRDGGGQCADVARGIERTRAHLNPVRRHGDRRAVLARRRL